MRSYLIIYCYICIIYHPHKQMAVVFTKKMYSRPETDEVIVMMEHNIASNDPSYPTPLPKIVDNPTEFDWDED